MAGYRKGKAVKLTKNFKTTEFDCKCGKYCSTTLIDKALVNQLQMIRDHFDKPVLINSGYRCVRHNRNVGGANNSQHLYGKAADIVVKGVSPQTVAKYAETIGFKGIGTYRTFTHVDTRKKRARWQGQLFSGVSLWH